MHSLISCVKDCNSGYAILMGAPQAGSTVTLKALTGQDLEISQVSLQSDPSTNWQRTDAGLMITVPFIIDTQRHGTVFKIGLN
jgi:hypothetical protein